MVVGDSIAALSVILTMAMFGAGIITMPVTILLIISLVALKSKKKYVEPTATELESAIVNACNSDKNRHAVTQMTGMSKFFTASQIRQ